MLRRLPRTIVLLAALAAALALPAAAGAAEPGINTSGMTPTQSLDLSSQAGARWMRVFVRWDELEAGGRGKWSSAPLSSLDQTVAGAQARGIKLVAVVMGAPRWANGSSDYLVPPSSPQEYGRFLGALAARYKGRVAAWEIWNEPDETEFWHATPGAGSYAPLLAAAHAGIEAADPSALVLAAASTGNNYAFLEGLYAAGAGNAFDGVAVHTDTACNIASPDVYYRENGRVGRFSFLGLREVHATLDAHGDGAKPIIMSEIGWAATSTTCARGVWAGQKAAGVTEAQQAAFLKLAYRCLSFYPYVKAALWFNLKDGGTADTELNRYGLMRSDGSHRPAYDAFTSVAKYGPPTSGDCGDFTPPDVNVVSPSTGSLYAKTLTIKASAHDHQSALGRMTFYANGRKIRSFTGSALKPGKVVGLEWMGARSLPYGDVAVRIEALDEFGNTASREVTVKRVDPATLPVTKTRLSLKVSGHGLTRTVRGRLTSALPFAAEGKVLVSWQNLRGSRWVTVHKRSRNANKAFSYRQRLARAGRWRVVATYAGKRPFKASSRTLSAFSAR